MPFFAFLSPLLGVLAGFVLAAFLYRTRVQQATEHARATAMSEAGALQGSLESARQELAQCRTERDRFSADCTHAREKCAAVEARLQSESASLQRQKEDLLQDRKAMEDSFRRLAAEALEVNAKNFLPKLEAELAKQHEKATAVFDKKQTAMDELLKPMRETLDRLQTQNRELESKRIEAYTNVVALMDGMEKSHLQLRAETTSLVQALRKPEVRGNWGERLLEQCLQFAGMREHVNYEKQFSVVNADEKTQRPDYIVKLPNGRIIVIDSKVPLDAYLTAQGTADDATRSQLLAQHAQQLRKHLSGLGTKQYGRALAKHGAPEVVVCFLPGEGMLSAALDADPSLIEYSPNVVLATPTTLIALLKAIACGWQQLEIARSAEQIRETAESIYAKLCAAQKNVASLGNNLGKAVDEYNEFLTKVEGRGGIFSLGRKLNAMQIGEKAMPEPVTMDRAPRMLNHADWESQDLSLAAVAESATTN